MIAEKKETYPLSWPEDWPRTRPQDRRQMASWKRTANQYRDALVTELTRMESPSAVISCNVPLNLRGTIAQGEGGFFLAGRAQLAQSRAHRAAGQ